MTNTTFEIKTKNGFDRRKWVITSTDNRLDVVKALGSPFTPKRAAEMTPGKWYGIQKDVHVRVVNN